MRSGRRPDIDAGWPTEFVSVMTQCWDSDPARRGTFEGVCEQWAAIAAASSPDKRLSIGNMLRRTTNRTSLISIASRSSAAPPATTPPATAPLVPLGPSLVELPANARASLIDDGGISSSV